MPQNFSSSVPVDKHYNNIAVHPQTSRGAPNVDALFSDLSAEKYTAFGTVPNDATFSKLAVQHTISPSIVGYSPIKGTSTIGKL